MSEPQSPPQHCLFLRISLCCEPDPHRKLFLNWFFSASRAAYRNTSRCQAERRFESLRGSCLLQKLDQFLHQKKMQAPIAAMLGLPKLKNDVPRTNSPARRFLCRRPRQWLCNAEQRVIAFDRRKKILNRKTCRRFRRSYSSSTRLFRNLSNRLHAHACEATRRHSTLQAQTLANGGKSPSLTLTPPIPAAPRSC